MDGRRSNLIDTAQLAAWPTTTRQDASSSVAAGYETSETHHAGVTLTDAARRASWATPVTTEIGNTLESYRAMKANMRSGPRTAITHPSMQAQLATRSTPGTPASGSGAPTGGGGQLNPAHSRWQAACALSHAEGRPISNAIVPQAAALFIRAACEAAGIPLDVDAGR